MSEITVTPEQINSLAEKLAGLTLDDTERALLLAVVSAGVQAVTAADDVEGFLLPAVQVQRPGASQVRVNMPGGSIVQCDGSVMPSSGFGGQIHGILIGL